MHPDLTLNRDGMESSNHERAHKVHSSLRHHVNVFQPSSPPRVSTEPPQSTATKHRHLHSLHVHHSHRHGHHHSHSRSTKDAVQSAIQLQPPIGLGDLLNRTKTSALDGPSQSNPESRRASVAVDWQTDGNAERADRKPLVSAEEVEKERMKAKARESELRSSLQKLSDHSLKTSRRLDDTYYSILEKVSVLRQTIGSLQELSGLTHELHENFQSDTKELTEEIQVQIEGFGNFDVQEEQVKGLEDRIKAGMEKAEGLNKRLDEARKRVEKRAEMEQEWQARTDRRLKMLWGILGTVAGLIVLVILFQQLKPIPDDAHYKHDPNFRARSIIEANLPESAKEAMMSCSTCNPSSPKSMASVSSSIVAEDDPRLRIFDEL